MKIAIIVAMDKELQLLLPMLENLAEADVERVLSRLPRWEASILASDILP